MSHYTVVLECLMFLRLRPGLSPFSLHSLLLEDFIREYPENNLSPVVIPRVEATISDRCDSKPTLRSLKLITIET
jgi:hypothetical protein